LENLAYDLTKIFHAPNSNFVKSQKKGACSVLKPF
jgi:hypothetical protein